MIVEVRAYRTEENRRSEFLDFFVKRAIPALQRTAQRFHLAACVSSLEERERVKSAFYESDEWKNELEKIAMPMLDAYMFSLTGTLPGFVSGVITESI